MAGILGRALVESPQPSPAAAPPQAPQAQPVPDIDHELSQLLRDNNVPEPIQTKLKEKQIFTVKALGFIGGGVQSVALAMLSKNISYRRCRSGRLLVHGSCMDHRFGEVAQPIAPNK